MTTDILARSRADQETVRRIRRELHRHPEVGSDLPRTKALVAGELAPLGLDVRLDVGGGIVADLQGKHSAPPIALRADMDALAMDEDTGLPFSSEVPGHAHMCGHDAHTAMLLGAVRLLASCRDQLPGPVRFLFQPNEENQPGGAQPMIRAGCLDTITEVFGLHVWPGHAPGWVGTRPGPLMARPDVFSISLTGNGGHASAPSQCLDPIWPACRLVCDLQTILPRRISPHERAVISVTRIQAGTAYNIIPDTAFIQGTVRSLSEEAGDIIEREMGNMVRGTGVATGLRTELNYVHGFPVLFNAASSVTKFLRAGRTIGAAVDDAITPVMAGEDFSHYLEHVPGCFFFLGCGAGPGQKGLHSSCFTLDEDCLPWGVAVLSALALDPDRG